MAKIELNYMLGDEVWFLFPIYKGDDLKENILCKGVVQDIDITLMGLSFVKYLVRYINPLTFSLPMKDKDDLLTSVDEVYFDEAELYPSKEELIEANKDKAIIEK